MTARLGLLVRDYFPNTAQHLVCCRAVSLLYIIRDAATSQEHAAKPLASKAMRCALCLAAGLQPACHLYLDACPGRAAYFEGAQQAPCQGAASYRHTARLKARSAAIASIRRGRAAPGGRVTSSSAACRCTAGGNSVTRGQGRSATVAAHPARASDHIADAGKMVLRTRIRTAHPSADA